MKTAVSVKIHINWLHAIAIEHRGQVHDIIVNQIACLKPLVLVGYNS